MAFIMLDPNPLRWDLLARMAWVIMSAGFTYLQFRLKTKEIYIIQKPNGQILSVFKSKSDAEIFTSKSDYLIITKSKIR